MFLSSYRNTRESLAELEKAAETLAYGSCSRSISRSSKRSLVCLQLDRITVHVFYFLNKLSNRIKIKNKNDFVATRLRYSLRERDFHIKCKGVLLVPFKFGSVQSLIKLTLG